jgi:hypothetical protein
VLHDLAGDVHVGRLDQLGDLSHAVAFFGRLFSAGRHDGKDERRGALRAVGTKRHRRRLWRRLAVTDCNS